MSQQDQREQVCRRIQAFMMKHKNTLRANPPPAEITDSIARPAGLDHLLAAALDDPLENAKFADVNVDLMTTPEAIANTVQAKRYMTRIRSALSGSPAVYHEFVQLLKVRPILNCRSKRSVTTGTNTTHHSSSQ